MANFQTIRKTEKMLCFCVCGKFGEPTFTTVLPHAQIDVRDVITAAVSMRMLSYPKRVLLDACDIVPIIAQHPCQRRLFQLGQLGWCKHAWIFVPKPK